MRCRPSLLPFEIELDHRQLGDLLRILLPLLLPIVQRRHCDFRVVRLGAMP